MPDVLFVAVIVVFFALVTLFVRVCDRIIGPDEELVSVGGVAPEQPAESKLAA
ncbi:MAG: hypothetical protein QOJ19_4530 [Acidimicrobiia bacterium]|nr:hypothetical protein [Acidimicrobiia bacterium]